MNCSVGDHLYIRSPDKKTNLVVRVKSISKPNIIVKEASTYHFSPAFTVTPDWTIIANLGSDPAVPNIDGLPTKSYIGYKKLSKYSTKLYFFYKPEKEYISNIENIFNDAFLCLRKNKIDQFIPDLVFDIHSKQTYKAPKNALGFFSNKTNQIRLYADKLECDTDKFKHAILHEMSHYFRKLLAKDEILSEWTVRFAEISDKVCIQNSRLKEIIESFLVSNTNLSSFCKTLDNEDDDSQMGMLSDRKLFKSYVASAARYYNLSSKDINTLSKNGKYDLLEKILLNEMLPLAVRVTKGTVSEYATKNQEEFFAEVLAFYLEGKVLSSKDQLIAKKTIDALLHLTK